MMELYTIIELFLINNPKSILLKISGLDSNNTVYMSPWEFDDDHEYTEEHGLVHRNRFTKDGEPIDIYKISKNDAFFAKAVST